MAGFNDWIEIFEGGLQEDSRGRSRYYSDADLDHLINTYDPSKHEAPLVFGHPVNDEPALGWVEALKREGKKVLAKFKQVPMEVSEWVKNGFWKKRSASIRSDGTLKHVGLLGAVPPAIKGLTDIKFQEDEQDLIYYFNENGGNDMAVNAKVEPKAEQAADPKEKEIQDLKSALAEFMERQKEKDKEIAELKTKAASSDFAEKAKQKDDEILNLKAQLEKVEQEKRQAEYGEFCEKNKNRITPAMRPFIMDAYEIFHSAGSYDFSEGTEKNAVKRWETFLEKLPVQVEFSEVAVKDKAAAAGKASEEDVEFAEFDNVNADEKALDTKIKAYMKQHNVSYNEAYKKVGCN